MPPPDSIAHAWSLAAFLMATTAAAAKRTVCTPGDELTVRFIALSPAESEDYAKLAATHGLDISRTPDRRTLYVTGFGQDLKPVFLCHRCRQVARAGQDFCDECREDDRVDYQADADLELDWLHRNGEAV